MSKYLLVTEKFKPICNQRDGGSMLVNDLVHAFGDNLDVMNFSVEENIDSSCRFNFIYPKKEKSRFNRRVGNSSFISEQIQSVVANYDVIIFIHLSLLFNFSKRNNPKINIVTFPMFTSKSYSLSGENGISDEYISLEKQALRISDKIITPSYFEKKQLVNDFHINADKIVVIPRRIDKDLFSGTKRTLREQIHFCSVGSIKKQKNTLELVRLFGKLTKDLDGTLTIIGAIQDDIYYKEVVDELSKLNIEDKVEIKGFIKQSDIKKELEEKHIHLSVSNCETFGRSIFETLSLGIPNICSNIDNAAYDFLKYYDGAHFFENENEFDSIIKDVINNYEFYSESSLKQVKVFSSKVLNEIIVSEILNQEPIVVCDFDGTIFHKNSLSKTIESISIFNKYSIRIICSSRGANDLINYCKQYKINADYIIAWNGAVALNNKFDVLWLNAFTENEKHELEKLNLSPELYQERIIQYKGEDIDSSKLPNFVEKQVYSDACFYIHKENQKLSAIIKLLERFNIKGRVNAFGDGDNDLEFLKYFDGCFMKNDEAICQVLNFTEKIYEFE